MPLLITYSPDTEAQLVDLLKSEFSREDVVYVVDTYDDRNDGFMICAPFIKQINPGLMIVGDTFDRVSADIKYGYSVSVIKCGLRTSLHFYTSFRKIIVDRQALFTNPENAIYEPPNDDPIMSIRVLPGKMSNIDILNTVATSVRRILHSAVPGISNLSASPRNEFILRLIDTIGNEMARLGNAHPVIRTTYQFDIHPVVGDESVVSVEINIGRPLSEKRAFGIDDIILNARRGTTTLTNTSLSAIARLFVSE